MQRVTLCYTVSWMRSKTKLLMLEVHTAQSVGGIGRCLTGAGYKKVGSVSNSCPRAECKVLTTCLTLIDWGNVSEDVLELASAVEGS